MGIFGEAPFREKNDATYQGHIGANDRCQRAEGGRASAKERRKRGGGGKKAEK